MMTDPIADFLTRIKNGYDARKPSIVVPYSTIKQQIAGVLSASQYIGAVRVNTIDEVKKEMVVELLYNNKESRVEEIIRVSTPGRRVYVDASHIPTVLQGRGMVIISTSQGIMSGGDAKKKRIGGEVICKIW